MSARVITAAALIMIAVFGSFVAQVDPTIKMFGIGLATAVLLDATVVRMVFVPAALACSGVGHGGSPLVSSGSCRTSTSRGTGSIGRAPPPSRRRTQAGRCQRDPVPLGRWTTRWLPVRCCS